MSLVLGLPGMPAAAEDVMIGRDIIAGRGDRRTNSHHARVDAGSVELVRRAKRRGVRVTTEVCPHHFDVDR